MNRIILIGAAIVVVNISCNKEEKPATDYREKYCGNYDIIVISSSYIMGDTNLNNNYDTTIAMALVEKFAGYTCPFGSNYFNIGHKLGITFRDDFTFDSHPSSCNDTVYYTSGYLHPTVANNGILSYPEMTCDWHASFQGSFSNDSINISMGRFSMGGGWSKKILGIKTD